MSQTEIQAKEPQMSVLTPLEQDCLKDVVAGERYTGKNVAEIKTQLFAQLLEHEKQSIYEISEIDESLREVRGNLDDLDEEFKQLENIIENQTNEYLGIINDMSNFETQSKIVNTRINNYERLKETLQMLIGETYFTDDEIASLTEPDFENTAKIEASLATLSKIAKYIRNSNRFTANKYIVSKNQEFTRNVDIFEARLKEYIKKLAKKAAKYHSDKGSIEDTQLVDTSFFRKSMTSLRGIFHQMFIIHDFDDRYFKSLVNDIGSQISEFTTSTLGNFEKNWKSTMSTFNIFNKKWNITSQMEINAENLNENKNNKMKLTSFFESVIGNFDEQMESDENFWTKFFSFDDRRLTKESNEIKYFLNLIYALPKQKIVKLLNSTKETSSISTFFMLAEVKKILQIKQKDEDQPASLKGKDDMTYSYAAIHEIFKELNNHNNMFAQEQIKYLDEHKADAAKGTVLLPVRNYTALATTLYEIFAKTNKDIFLINIVEIYTAIKAWLYKVAATQPQHRDALIVHNTYHIYSNFSKINDKRYIEMATEMKDVFERHSKAYAKAIFCRTFTRFSEYWFKLKEISEQNDITAVQLSGSYSKTSFLKLSKATFSQISLAIESMIKRLSEEFPKDKDAALLKLQYEKLTEYLLKEYEEIEKFAVKAYSERVSPTKSEIQAVLIDKRP